MTTYIIGIGGTGAKCIEAISRLAGVGLFGRESLKVLFVDADETNGNLDRARNSLTVYRRCYDLTSSSASFGWMATKLESLDLWSPFTDLSLNKELRTFFNYNTIKQNQPPLGNLFDVLYTKDEQEANLDVGFRGRPAIGAAVMSQVDLDKLDQEPWGSFVKEIQRDVGAGNAAKVFLCGSIFGGTGASGLPTIARLIANKLKNLNVRDRISIGCLFMLPYFGFTAPPGEDPDGVYARSEQFLLNTEAALRYYVTQAQSIFDTVYLLGNQNLSRVEFSIGKNSQRNQPHFIELFAGLAARHFSLESGSSKGSVVLISRESPGRVTWSDFPDPHVVKPQLVQATRFAYGWLGEIVPELNSFQNQQGGRMMLTPWLMKFFPSRSRGNDGIAWLNDATQQEAMVAINSWCQDYLGWLHAIHQLEGESLELFATNIFAEPEQVLPTNRLADLVANDGRDARSKSRDNIQQLKKDLQKYKPTVDEQGIVGLARVFYNLCKH